MCFGVLQLYIIVFFCSRTHKQTTLTAWALTGCWRLISRAWGQFSCMAQPTLLRSSVRWHGEQRFQTHAAPPLASVLSLFRDSDHLTNGNIRQRLLNENSKSSCPCVEEVLPLALALALDHDLLVDCLLIGNGPPLASSLELFKSAALEGSSMKRLFKVTPAA